MFPTQGSNSGVPHCREILYHVSYQGSPRILEWVAYPFSSRSSQPRNWTGVSCIAGKFFTSWATREGPKLACTLLISALTGFMSSLCILLTCILPQPHSQYLSLRMNPLTLQMCCKELDGLSWSNLSRLFLHTWNIPQSFFPLVLLTYNWQRALYV